MTDALVYHRVADYDAWKREYDRVIAGPMASDLRSHRVWRGQDDRNLVIASQSFDSREAAEALFTSQALRDEMANAGVDMSSVQIEYLDEVDSGTR